MINPRMVKTWHERFNDRARGSKFYRTGFELPGHAKFSLRKFRTASEAEGYGARVILRWMRLYDASIAVLADPPVPALPRAEEGGIAVAVEG